MNKAIKTFMVVSAVVLFALPAWATSSRISPVDSDYGVHDFTLTTQHADHFYSSGLDIVYVNGVRHFITLWNTTQSWPDPPDVGNEITLSVYDYTGNWVMDLTTYTDPLNEDGNPDNDVVMFPQSVKLDPTGSTVWFSYTANDSDGNWNVSDWFCTVPWDHTLSMYPQSATSEFQFSGNWEMEWSTDPGAQWQKPFVSGTDTDSGDDYNAIFLYTSGAGLQKVIDTEGWSAGFAFDNAGNLWYANCDSNYPGSNHIYMWTAGQIDTAITTPSVLALGDATVTIATPNNGGGSDVERDSAGNLYFSLNGGTTYLGELVRVSNNGTSPWPSTTTTLTQTVEAYDWERSLAFDGLGALATPGKQEASNRLYLDMDQGSQGVTTPTVVGVSVASDAEADGVPDALDNCWEHYNADQVDEDADGYGDTCDTSYSVFNDYDGDGIADVRDWSWDTPDDQTTGFNEFTALINNWLSSPAEPHMDHDGDGVVGFFEFQFLIDAWLQPQPLHPLWP
jgi:hypothetical protein